MSSRPEPAKNIEKLEKPPIIDGLHPVPNPDLDGLHPVPYSTICAVSDSNLEVAEANSVGAAPRAGTDGISTVSDEPAATGKSAPPPVKQASRRKLFWILGVILFLVGLGAILGGVLGSKAAKHGGVDDTDRDQDGSDGETTPHNSPSPTAASEITSSFSAPTSIPTSIGRLSPLSVVPLKPYESKKYLFFLGFKSPKGRFYYSIADSTRPRAGSTAWDWGAPQLLAPTYPTDDNAGLWLASEKGKLNLYLLNSSQVINGLAYDSAYEDINGELLYRQNDIDKEGFVAAKGSSVGVYGPWLVYQSTENSLDVVRNMDICTVSRINAISKEKLGIDIQLGTKLAIVPLTTNGLDIGLGSVGVFYQRTNGYVDLYPISSELEYKSNNYTPPSPSGPWGASIFPGAKLPDGNSFAAFATPQSDNTTDPIVVVTFLYQDFNGDIKEMRADGSAGWKTTSPQALKDADAGTSITCVALSPWSCDMSNNPNGQLFVAPVERIPDFTRCFFWKKGFVVEVRRDEKGWVNLGPVNLP